MGAQETIGQGLVFAQEPEKQMLSLDIRRPELAGFVACEKYDAPRFLRIAFKHNAPAPGPSWPGRTLLARPAEPRSLPTLHSYSSPTLCNQTDENPSTETIL